MEILTTHVGSLPRSKRVVDFIFAREKKQNYNQEDFDNALSDEIDFNVRKQKEIGISIVSDGEASKISYATYIKDRYKGFDGDSIRNPPADLKLFPKFLEKLAKEGGTPQYSRPMCVDKIESKIDHYNANLSALNSFILPGGSEASSLLHLSRTIARRAERDTSLLSSEEKINMESLTYLNRLSDLLFVLCRVLNENGLKDILWIPGLNQE